VIAVAELYKGRVINMTFGGGDVSDVKVFERLLEGVDGISGFAVDLSTNTLVAFADEPDSAKDDIVRALLASGMYPVTSTENASVDGRGRLAC